MTTEASAEFTEGGIASRQNQQGRAFAWSLCAPFLTSPTDRWISDYTTSDRHRFEIVPRAGGEVSWHTKKAARTGLVEWRDFAKTAANALDLAVKNDGGVVTVFPQLAAAVASRKKVRRQDQPLVAWFFNTNFGRDVRSKIAKRALSGVDRFVVHSTVEIEAYAAHLQLSPSRFEFVPVQYGGTIQTDEEDNEQPFVLATGSGFRDYATFFDAMRLLDMPAKVVAGDRVLEGLTPPPNVEIISGIDRDEINRLTRRARVNVIPINDEGLTGGIITIVGTFRHGRGLVVSDRSGIDDYVRHDDNSLVVPLRDPAAMAEAIEAMFTDADLRQRLGSAAATFADQYCTDTAVAAELERILDLVVSSRAGR